MGEGAHNQSPPLRRSTSPSARQSHPRGRKPSVRPIRKRVRQPAQSFSSPVVSNDEGQQQIIGVEFRPVGGIFGTSEGLEIPPEPSRRRFRIPRSLRDRRREAAEPSLWADEDFSLLWWSRLLSQTAQGALLYALLILVVDLSDRTIFNSIFVILSMIPSIAFGLPAGMVVDNMNRKLLLVCLNGFRFLFMLFMVAVDPTIPGVLACTLGIWIIHQFYSPSEASMLADIVPARRYTEAQSLFNLALTISQGVGLIILAPILLRTGGAQLVFVLAGGLWLIAGALSMLLPSISVEDAIQRRPRRRNLLESLGAGWQFVKHDRPTLEAILDDVLVSVGMSSLVVIIPFYLENVLGTSKTNTVFVFAPAALGLVIGLRLATVLAQLIGERLSASLSLAGFALCILSLGFVEQTFAFLTMSLRLPLDSIADMLSIPRLIILAMLISIPAGICSSVVNVAARSILLRRTPAYVRGQVIATQSLIGNILGLVPTLLAGIATDLFGVLPVAVGIAVILLIAGVLAHEAGRRPSESALAPA